ncbi:hypothetical protein COY65_00725 [Candidatus Jorgensenbacteria bacterium CG_4_10_14_0_8_um_filter_39_13]|uniref:DNA methylase adenine-specific domain-containing protein n=2 Tax=Candidatus Joergenseniibacteriota TaxID=1752739 RepID=A0A2M7RIQ2_9BACT|nr:MAG: hypothetical protein COV54_02345 [Candidatus Jorgensenbacteria bacterium CG11_big_fil_rev_8_21_14_0_20_38_23]PIV13459.1 MAG: hypothetical protein COS46_00115 [Candidatus Jorgensenbacteria bacterium CG03_land_8_20_14_0_80_38_39]PIW97362.1 MAG: hypothetical protein COZ81_02900 [Candidatus Jorgensenbacteria bacterium CG_4_8_14_3_um_filter_38_10]PIY96407.1 MAG: hypothetical protein COY65_00725 [Candidatus Jorgensenbacteria bacterium CG_4_10_14_0_8_um_filter_39_13]PJA95096.1 MAG: hypothetica
MDVLVSFIVLILLIPVAYGAVIGAPLIFAPKKAIRIMIKEANIKNNEIVYDLGAGTGRLIVMAKKEFLKNIYGIEIALIIWLIGKINLFVNKVKISNLKLGNFYKSDFGNIDIFLCFLTPKAMKKLKNKFETETKKGSRIISYAFEINGWKPKKIIKEKGIASIFVYEI